MSENVVIIGASAKESRYAYKAQTMLADRDHTIYPYNPFGGESRGLTFISDFSEISDPIDTVTLYVAPKRLLPMIPDILSLKPKRIIFNPGTEDNEAMRLFREAEVEVIEACTLVMLSTNQF